MTVVVVVVVVYAALVLATAVLMWKLARIPFPAKSTILAIEDASLPKEMLGDLREAREGLAALGFEPTESVRFDYGTFSTAYSIAFRGPGDTFAVYNFETTHSAGYIEFRTRSGRFGDIISVARWPTPLDGARPPAGLLLSVPPMESRELLAFHERAREAIAGDDVLPQPKDAGAHLLAFHDARFARAFRDGLMVLRSGTTRLTWSYALKCALLTLPPARNVAAALNRSNACGVLSDVPAGRLGRIRAALRAAAAQ
jgi:hypothetical protein